MTLSSKDRSRGGLLKGDEGAIALMFAVSASIMIGSMCTALDAIDYVMTQGRMQMALDAATLSAGADLARYGNTPTGTTLSTWQTDARAYYDANMSSGLMGSFIPDAKFTATVTGAPSTGQTIALSTSGALPLLAPKILSVAGSSGGSGSTSTGSTTPDTSTVSASNTALRMPQSTLELVMVLDNTGSMKDPANGGKKGDSKMVGLKNAANMLIGLLLPAGSSSSTKNYIGLVPFASTVNVLNMLPSSGSWLSSSWPIYNTNGLKTSSWNGCTVEPRSNGDLLPQAYSPTDTRKFSRYYYNVPSANGNGSPTFNGVTYKYGSLCDTQKNHYSTQPYTGVPVTLGSSPRANWCSYPSTGQGTGIGYQVDQLDSSGTTLTQNSDCIGTPVTFLTRDADTLTTNVNNMTSSGSTIIPLGLLWGWRMLEPAWSQNVAGTKNGWVSTDPSLPKPTDGTVQNLQRVMIVLTDGQNQIGAAGTIPNDLYFNGLSGIGTNDLKASTVLRSNGKYMTDGRTDAAELHGNSPIDTTTSNGAGWPDDVNTFQQAVCAAIKAQGITIYSITFGASAVSSSAQVNMQNCASPGNYYHAPDNPTLTSIFQQIAGSLGVLRLTQ